jgi:S-adenosylmethionine:tRNA ribosyltransferase-isomerase
MKNYILNINDYDFELPKKCIAQFPSQKRDESKLLIYDRLKDKIFHKKFYEIANYFGPDDLLLINTSEVIPARLAGEKKDSGGKIEIIVLDEKNSADSSVTYSVLAKYSKIKNGQKINFSHNLSASVHIDENKTVLLTFHMNKKDFLNYLKKYGSAPLPPYIKRHKEDENKFDLERYQTVYADTLGSIAAPTAGLHFTKKILENIKDRGTIIVPIILHVGLGTFRMINSSDIREHVMLPEYFDISDENKEKINLCLKNNYKITSVGTTSTRTIESFLRGENSKGYTNLYIYPGHKFFINRLITNFHVPRSTPLVLVSAFIADHLRESGEENFAQKGIEIIKRIYKEAIEKDYRFYSYGDSMMII